MKQSEAITLIKQGISINRPQHWADLGCGSGTFTKALADLLPHGSQIDAIDEQHQNLKAPINFIRANFEKDDLPLSGLDGILMANSLHYIGDKQSLIQKLENYFTENPTFLLVEYDTSSANPWVPYPLPYLQLEQLFKNLNYLHLTKLAERPSVYSRAKIYAALVQKK